MALVRRLGRARPCRARRVEGARPPAARAGAGRRTRLGGAARRAPGAGRRGAQRARRASRSWPASSSTAARRATSARWASGSARTPRGRGGGRRGRRRRAGRGAARRRGTATVAVDGAEVAGGGRGRDRHRDPARGLGGRDGRRRDGGARPHDHRRSCAAPGWPARSCGWCRRPARRPGSTSPTGSTWAVVGRRVTTAAAIEAHLADDLRRGAGASAPYAARPSRRCGWLIRITTSVWPSPSPVRRSEAAKIPPNDARFVLE